jgi:hypothetical protein
VRQIRITFIVDIPDEEGHLVAKVCSMLLPLADDQDFSSRCLGIGQVGHILDSDAAHPMSIPGCADASSVWIAPHCIRRVELLTGQGEGEHR